MKRNWILFCAALLLSFPLHAQQNDDWKNAQATWQQVQELSGELDELVAKRQLEEVHDAALEFARQRARFAIGVAKTHVTSAQ